MTLDARKAMGGSGVATPPPHVAVKEAPKPKAKEPVAEQKKVAVVEKTEEELSNEDMYFKNIEREKKENEQKRQLQNKFEGVSQDLKDKAFSDALGLDNLIQTNQQ